MKYEDFFKFLSTLSYSSIKEKGATYANDPQFLNLGNDLRSLVYEVIHFNILYWVIGNKNKYFRLYFIVKILLSIVFLKLIMKIVVKFFCQCLLKWDFVMLLIPDTPKKPGHGLLKKYFYFDPNN